MQDRFIAGVIALLVAILAACSPPVTISVPASPSPQSQAGTPTIAASPSPSPATPTTSPTQTPIPSPTFDLVSNPIPPNLPLPLADIEILSPGDGARLVSPIEIAANLITGPEGRLRIELLNQDGETLARKVLIWNLLNAVKQRVHTALDFEINGVAEAGRLLISVDDDYGRLRALSAVDILLLAEGPYEESPALEYIEKLVILNPSAESVLESGDILIQGIARTQSDRPLTVQLIARDGRVLASGDVYVAHPEGYDYGVFSITLSAQVSSRQWIQVAVRENGDRIPGTVHYSTLEFVLTP